VFLGRHKVPDTSIFGMLLTEYRFGKYGTATPPSTGFNKVTTIRSPREFITPMIWLLMAEAAVQSGVLPRQRSFKPAVQVWVAWSLRQVL
jgi:hypothetical protein